jgi:hypothetical protein
MTIAILRAANSDADAVARDDLGPGNTDKINCMRTILSFSNTLAVEVSA